MRPKLRRFPSGITENPSQPEKPRFRVSPRLPLRVPTLLAVAALLVSSGLLLPGCNVQSQPNFMIGPQINHMVFSSAAESQTENSFLANGRTLQTPPEGTIPRGFKPLHYTGDKEEAKTAGDELKNPMEKTPENLARGKWGYMTFCTPCHGEFGYGDGPVSKRGMPGFPITPKDSKPVTEGYKDGHIFHIITYGRGMMGSYASQIEQKDRWKIILHLRELQAAAANVPAKGGK